jgi:hypothetical protein
MWNVIHDDFLPHLDLEAPDLQPIIHPELGHLASDSSFEYLILPDQSQTLTHSKQNRSLKDINRLYPYPDQLVVSDPTEGLQSLLIPT